MSFRPDKRLPDETCPTCGSLYQVVQAHLMVRDQDSANCSVCGVELRSWNGSVIYHYTLKTAAPWPRDPGAP